MLFLPAELAKEARNEVLSRWMEPGHELQFRTEISFNAHHVNDSVFVSRQIVQQRFPTLPPALYQFQKKWVILTTAYQVQGVFFPLFAVKVLWRLWLKSCCIVVWQANGIQCVRINSFRYNQQWIKRHLEQIEKKMVELNGKSLSIILFTVHTGLVMEPCIGFQTHKPA